MEMIGTFFIALWELTAAMAPYILFGLFFAGILYELVPDDFVQRHLGRDNVMSVLKATLFGIPLPVCSCGVIPLAAALKKEGASRGAVLSFLISTPITGIDSILATFGMFGWLFTLYRIVTSILIAFAAGVLSNFYAADEKVAATPSSPSPAQSVPPLFTAATAPSAQRPVAFTPKAEPAQESACGCDDSCNEEEGKRFSFAAAMRYGFVTLMGDIAKPLLWGLLLGAAITAAMPEDLGIWLAQYTWLGYLLVIAVAVPMYVCATASLPIAASLVLGGVSMGAAFVFLSAGPATNTVTMGVVKKMLGSRALAIYIGVIVAGSLLFGFMIDALFASLQIDPKAVVHLEERVGLVAALSSVLLWLLTLRHIAAPRFRKGKPSCCSG
ncbi:SO_0444 family Cu/Zn efflux transporter [Hydrogenimonas sp. SS33]|uniref:SO_0444 family Cu/Zn efflux transporter n=1 Tax=Hydrogenimonas leucolamina TaxID=2954236 RepID=UPI00336BE02F